MLVVALVAGYVARADSPDAEVLPTLSVYSPRVANQEAVASFAMPVTALSFEPQVDVQARNFAEGQADVSIRGGIFENTGFRIGTVSLMDPQTGHYLAELPITPAMLGAPTILTGADLGATAVNATAGAVAYSWRPIRTSGLASVGGGEFGTTQAEVYQGYVNRDPIAGKTVGADVSWAHSDSDGSIANGDHVLNRLNGRVQIRDARSQTDLFAGYQAKFFGWPNLYTPFNSNESEDLETVLLLANHRVDFGVGDYVEGSIYHRRNKDDYAYNRFAPVGPIRPYNHTTWISGAAVGARLTDHEIAWNFHAEALADELRSTSLVFGRFHTRSLVKASLIPERAWRWKEGLDFVAKAGVSYDDSNRYSGAWSPVAELSWQRAGTPDRLYVSYTETTQVPTYTALNASPTAGLFRGNPNLGRERSRNAEVGAAFTFDGWLTQAAVFNRQDNDLVDWTYARGVTARSANAVDMANTGFELVTRRSWQRFDLVLGYTWLTKDPDYRRATVDASFYAMNYARHRVTAAITARLSSTLELRLDNEYRDQAPNLLRTRGGRYPLLSALGLIYRPAALRRVSLAVQVANLWDSDFQEVPAVPASRRQWSANVAYVW